MHIRLLIISLASLALACCAEHRSPAWQQMDTAESVMETRPDSALSLLSDIDNKSLVDREERARHALLLSEALVKEGYLLTDDSIAHVALEYYKKKSGSEGLMKTLFFNADIAHTNHDDIRAMSMLLNAKEIAHQRKNDYWYAKIVELMGIIFSNSQNIEAQLTYSREAADHYKRAGKERFHRFAIVDYAHALVNSGDTKTGLTIVDSIRSVAKAAPADTLLMTYCEKTLFYLLIETERFSQAKDLYENTSTVNIADKLKSPIDRVYWANVLFAEGDTDGALQNLYLADSLSLKEGEIDKISIYWLKSKIYSAKGDIALAKTYADSIIVWQDMEVERLLKESVMKSHSDFYSMKAEVEKERAAKISIVSYVSILGIIILFVIGLILYRLRIRAKNAEIDSRIQDVFILTQDVSEKLTRSEVLIRQIKSKEREILTMREKMGETEKEITILKDETTKNRDAMRLEMATLFKDGWSILNMLCNEYFGKYDSEVTRHSILNDIELEINKLKNNKNLMTIEMSVNRYMDGIVDKMKQECSFLKPDDVTLLTLVAAGFSPRAICLFRNLKLKNFYMKKKRLLDRIKASEVHSKDTILMWLS